MERHPKKKIWKRKTKTVVTNLIQNFALNTNYMHEYIMSLIVEDIRATDTLCHDYMYILFFFYK